jgi:epoxyqueuosine reductase
MSKLSSESIVDQLRTTAQGLGFAELRITPAIASSGFAGLQQWIEAGYAGEMHYFENRLDAYRHPQGVLPEVRSLIMLAFPYPALARSTTDPPDNHPPVSQHGKLARYAWTGDDYHDVIHEKLRTLIARLKVLCPDAKARGVVDTAPLLEREFAELAGLGWRAKNTLLINKLAGSYFFLACVLTDVELPLDVPHPTDHCGTCTRCLDACPTDAFPQPGVLDATRCISYLTIESREPIPIELRSGIGDWVFGCDVCQEVCPWNQPARLVRLEAPSAPLQPKLESLDLYPLFSMNDDDFRGRYRNTPFWRTRRRGLLRNAAIVLGNQQDPQALKPLLLGLNDPEPMVRGASAWAIRQIGGSTADAIIAARLGIETDDTVRQELTQ